MKKVKVTYKSVIDNKIIFQFKTNEKYLKPILSKMFKFTKVEIKDILCELKKHKIIENDSFYITQIKYIK